MTNAAPELGAKITRIMHADRGRLLAALIRSLGNFDLAEDALQDAAERALVHWARNGLPRRPDAWLLQVARRSAIDRIRRAKRFQDRTPDIKRLMEEDEDDRAADAPDIPDERLRLIFTCCHPALDEKSRVALTLRTIGGLTTTEIARAFLDADTTMGQRLSRAKSKIAAAGIPYRIPERTEWDERLNSVLTVVYLIFNEGWTAGPGDAPIRTGLCDEALWLARLLTGLAPEDPEIEGLLALMLLLHARRDARFDASGDFMPLETQDRGLWDQSMIEAGLSTLDRAIARRLPGPFQIQAAISAIHVQAETPEAIDWPQIFLLYTRLEALTPSPVVRLNRAVALAETGDVATARRAMEAMADELGNYQPYHAALADLARRVGDKEAANAAYDRAITLSKNDRERQWLRVQKTTMNAV